MPTGILPYFTSYTVGEATSTRMLLTCKSDLIWRHMKPSIGSSRNFIKFYGSINDIFFLNIQQVIPMGWAQSWLTYLTVDSSESLSTLAGIAIDSINTDTTIKTWLRCTLINIWRKKKQEFLMKLYYKALVHFVHPEQKGRG